MFWTTNFAKLHWLEQFTGFCGDSKAFSYKEFPSVCTSRERHPPSVFYFATVWQSWQTHTYVLKLHGTALRFWLVTCSIQSLTGTFLLYHYTKLQALAVQVLPPAVQTCCAPIPFSLYMCSRNSKKLLKELPTLLPSW